VVSQNVPTEQSSMTTQSSSRTTNDV